MGEPFGVKFTGNLSAQQTNLCFFEFYSKVSIYGVEMKFFGRLNIVVLLSLLFIGAGNLRLVSAQTVSKVDEVRSKVREIGTGPDAKVELTLASGTSVK